MGNLVPRTVVKDMSLRAIEMNWARFHLETIGDPTNPVIVILRDGPIDGREGRTINPPPQRDGSRVRPAVSTLLRDGRQTWQPLPDRVDAAPRHPQDLAKPRALERSSQASPHAMRNPPRPDTRPIQYEAVPHTKGAKPAATDVLTIQQARMSPLQRGARKVVTRLSSAPRPLANWVMD
jgi:hypothetical protein